MKKPDRKWKSGWAVFAALMAISLGVASPAIAISWGEPDGNLHPNVGAVVIDDPEYGLFQLCSGTLIDSRVLLTAAHCTAVLETLQSDGVPIYVNFAEDALNVGTLLPVAEVKTHPRYNITQSNPRDVGALVLAAPVSITPATLPEKGFLDKLKKQGKFRQGKEEADFTVVGYGGTLSWPPPYIEYDDSRRYAESEYQTLLKSWLTLSQNQATGDGGTCYGDSGGPAFWTDPDEGEILVGITSWGDSPCVAIGFCYRVDTADTLDFIQDVLDDLP